MAREEINRRRREGLTSDEAQTADGVPASDEVLIADELPTTARTPVLLSGTADDACDILSETRFMTEYEERFVAQGKNIHKVIARKKR